MLIYEQDSRLKPVILPRLAPCVLSSFVDELHEWKNFALGKDAALVRVRILLK
jgi:hypothetical protein